MTFEEMALTRPRGPDRERWLVVAAVAFLAIVPAPVARAAEQGLSVNCIVQLGVMATALAQQSTCKANMTGVQSLTYQGILDRATSLVSKCLDSNLTDLRVRRGLRWGARGGRYVGGPHPRGMPHLMISPLAACPLRPQPVNGLFNADGADLFASLAPVLQSKSGFALRSVVAADTAAVMAEVLQQLNVSMMLGSVGWLRSQHALCHAQTPPPPAHDAAQNRISSVADIYYIGSPYREWGKGSTTGAGATPGTC